MKYTLLLTLLVAAAAQDGDGSQGADKGAQSQGADSSGGYGQQEAYGGGEEYSTGPIAAKCCVSVCPLEAPFFNPNTCACVPGLVEQEYHEHYATASYEAPQESYGGEAQTQSSGYRKLHASPEFSSGPSGTIDTRDQNITRAGTIVLWVTFGIFFILACYYLKMFHWYYTIADAADGQVDGIILCDDVTSSILHFLAHPALIAGVICLIASLAYLTMATGNGWYTRCQDGRMFFYARYIDWVITTPLILHALAHFANSPDEIWNFLFFCDIVVIVAGLIASTITGGEKWIFFGFAILAFCPVLYYICILRDQPIDNRKWDCSTGLLCGNHDGDGIYLPYIWFFGNYRVIADLTVVVWFLYPIVWIFAEGTNKFSVTGEAITYAILDLISKGVFGWLIVNSEFSHPCSTLESRYVDKTDGYGPTDYELKE